jgi:hypothetical protein
MSFGFNGRTGVRHIASNFRMVVLSMTPAA